MFPNSFLHHDYSYVHIQRNCINQCSLIKSEYLYLYLIIHTIYYNYNFVKVFYQLIIDIFVIFHFIPF
ncbi:hypothetical protein [Campylobacter phage CJLB-10]|nr:hypothetical protein [Campylobacter phage CJLB-10]